MKDRIALRMVEDAERAGLLKPGDTIIGNNHPQPLPQLNPFISITPSKPFMSSGSWLTLHYCEIYYLSAVNYDPATTDLILIRVNIYPGPGEGGLQLILKPIYFIRVTIYPATIPHNTSRGHYLPREVGGGCFLLIFQPIYFIRVTIYPVTLA